MRTSICTLLFQAFTALALVGVHSSATLASEPSAGGFRSEETLNVVEELREMLASRDGEALYPCLDSSYRRFVEIQEFSRGVSASSRIPKTVGLMKSVVQPDGGYLVLRTVSDIDGVPTEQIAVVFLSRIGGRWFLMNFPFAQDELPEFVMKPRYFCIDHHESR